ncbi:hypothetical protein E6O75_ATG00933 [Venturia nashicola]|uniref:Uncharacterized protein n=1 Tax=Venturia nashicola TaxID=86259 RepID=A0A4Z1PCC3_9PEZI|nr:hypothetical protein E6O75_ATG00933 [Venturia nashicola]
MGLFGTNRVHHRSLMDRLFSILPPELFRHWLLILYPEHALQCTTRVNTGLEISSCTITQNPGCITIMFPASYFVTGLPFSVEGTGNLPLFVCFQPSIICSIRACFHGIAINSTSPRILELIKVLVVLTATLGAAGSYYLVPHSKTVVAKQRSPELSVSIAVLRKDDQTLPISRLFISFPTTRTSRTHSTRSNFHLPFSTAMKLSTILAVLATAYSAKALLCSDTDAPTCGANTKCLDKPIPPPTEPVCVGCLRNGFKYKFPSKLFSQLLMASFP